MDNVIAIFIVIFWPNLPDLQNLCLEPGSLVPDFYFILTPLLPSPMLCWLLVEVLGDIKSYLVQLCSGWGWA